MHYYSNPILAADFSDPDVIRVGGDYYMVSSSFNYNPSIPVLHSVNLVDWELINYVMDELPFEEFKEVCHGCGVWAPAIRYHDGVFYCVFPIYGRGIWACKTTDIRGKWSAPWQIAFFQGLEDPCPIWTEDGKCYLAVAFAKSKAGFNSQIAVFEAAPDLSRVIGDYKIVYDGHNDNPCIEGPKFYRHGDYYYIYCPAGGVKHGWQTALRSKSIFGPYESKIVLMRHDGAVNGPHQGALVDLADGGWAFVHFCDMDAYGRITYLEPAEWINDWCLCGKVTDPLLAGTGVEGGEYPVDIESDLKMDYNDDFKSGVSPVWQTPAACGSGWYRAENGLKITASECEGGVYRNPRLLTQRFSAFDFTAETEADISELDGCAAFAVTGLTSYSLCLCHGRVELRQGNEGGERVLWSQKYKKSRAVLGVRVTKRGVDRAHVIFTLNGKSIPSPVFASKGRWVGSRLALYAEGTGEAAFAYFRITPAPKTAILVEKK